jgi:beta-1,4-mannooligosaccharide/beta-1,4-mannosyl-N-acetylglucosamine phosphorylase
MRRHPDNPILTREHIPAFSPALRDVSSVFNPGAIRHGDADLLILRVQTRSRETALVPALMRDDGGLGFFDGVATIEGLEDHPEAVHHVYDPRLTRVNGAVHMVFAMDVTDADGNGACRLGVASMRTPTRWSLVGVERSRDSRNGVLFPVRLGGDFVRLERPNRHSLDGGVKTGSSIRVARSRDLVAWDLGGEVMAGRWHHWDELIGSGPPPVLTRRGWLHVYHGVATHFASSNIYQAGVCLLDRDDPAVVVRRGALNILEPREPYELTGQVPNVVFPSGMVVEGFEPDEAADDGARVRLYYGAADTCVGRSDATVGELLAACDETGVNLGG